VRGIARPTLAYWLLRRGHQPTLVDRAPELRQGGYLIDFWGAGFDVAERMGVAGELRRRGYRFTEARAVGVDGRCVGSFETFAFLGSRDRYVSIARSDLAAVVFDALEWCRADSGRHVRSLEDHGDHVRVRLESGEDRDFDLVIGADGLHSQVRRLAFGWPVLVGRRRRF
jgi:2-polyprenyl-6-methoxyphenol hydroxylase-like FAD-dependent oxidoreductase